MVHEKKGLSITVVGGVLGQRVQIGTAISIPGGVRNGARATKTAIRMAP